MSTLSRIRAGLAEMSLPSDEETARKVQDLLFDFTRAEQRPAMVEDLSLIYAMARQRDWNARERAA